MSLKVRGMKIVIKLGGHLFPSRLSLREIRKYADLFKRLRRMGHSLIIVTGGGEDARKYARGARELGADESFCDQVGIEATRLNAMLLISSLGEDAYPVPPAQVSELKEALEGGKIVVMGGLTPGHSTDAVAAIAAELMKADALIRTIDTDGVYTADPKRNPKARKLEKVTPSELLRMILRRKYWAGTYALLDPVAVKIIDRSDMSTWIVNGKDPENIVRAIKGKRVGTLVKK